MSAAQMCTMYVIWKTSDVYIYIYMVHIDAAYHHCPVHGHGTKYQQIPIINIPIKSYDEPSRYPLYWLIGIPNVWATIHKPPKNQPGKTTP